MGFNSILFGAADANGFEPVDDAPPPDCFPDLNLDRLITMLTRGRDAYRLAPLFHQPLSDPELIGYRQAVMADIAQPAVRAALERFATTMRQRQAQRAQAASMGYRLQAQRWQLEAAFSYGRAVTELRRELTPLALASEGMRGFYDYLAAYADSAEFAAQSRATAAVESALAEVAYAVLIEDDAVEVRRFEGEADDGAGIEAAFRGLREADPPASDVTDRKETLGLTVLEAEILDRVAALFPDAFARLDAFCEAYADAVDGVITRFEREIQFYLAYRELMERLEALQGLAFCYPGIAPDKGDLGATGAYDVVLASALADGGGRVTTNDFRFEGSERILVVSGPNQGGKTTFARSLGQLHYLAALGLPVPATQARLLHVDAVITHFDREERIADQAGRLAADLERMRRVLGRAGAYSLVILNELFQATQADDASELTRRVLAALTERDALAVCVTFVDDVVGDGRALVSMGSTRDPDAPAQAAYRVVRRPPTHRAHADTLAAHHGLTAQALRRRLAG